MDLTEPDEVSIFNVARRISVPEVRRLYLEQSCAGEQGLRARLEALLRVYDEERSFLEAPAEEVRAVRHAPISEGPGTQVGPYKLLEQIGEGGFGVVYMAEQHQPVRRLVALKIVKPGMDTRQVIARFESERQALALMGHPNIAQIIDGGETASGRPYFVMELVRGVPITDFCDKNHLPAGERLKLFVSVCQAIQHAHYKGVLHRDIKPSNVMVTLHDGVSVVKIIDFGLAKATARKLTEKTLFTAYGQMIGTPAYMSPEQADMSGLDIDTRSDIYSLGVLLYELLTGTTPIDATQLREAGYAEMQRLIREEEPPRPSTRLSSLGDAATLMAGNRATVPKHLARLLAGDLDWIVMKALDKDRNRRYVTPGNFAEDVERYLRREAILARPPSATYRLIKLAQRHRVALLAMTAVAAALLVGTAVATWQAVVATRAKRDALVAAGAEKKAKETAQAKEAETRAVLDFIANKVLAAARPKGRAGGLGPQVTLRAAVEAALPFVENSFTNQTLIEARLRLTLGDSFGDLGDAKIAADQYQAALTIYRKNADPIKILRSMEDLANSYETLDRHADALRLREELLEIRKARFGPDHADTLESMMAVASSYCGLGRPAEAANLHEETLVLKKARLGHDHPGTLRSMHSLANCYSALGRHADALALREETLALRKSRLGPDHLDTLLSMKALANSYHALGRQADAVKLYEETLVQEKATLGPDHPDTLSCMNNLGNSYDALGRHTDALKLRLEMLALQKARLGDDHPETLRSMSNLANTYGDLDRQADALKLCLETLALQKAKLGPNDPDTLVSILGVASNLVKLDRGAEAVPIIDECLQRAAGKVTDPRLWGLMDLRLRYFAKKKDAGGCRTTAELWEKLQLNGPGSLLFAARFRALTAAVLRDTEKSPDAAQQAGAEADRAMAWLQQAVAAGYKDLASMNKNTDLDALRDRADFRTLMAELEAKSE
jgi:eukaryotic-like serine/threonine-protein kinase